MNVAVESGNPLQISTPKLVIQVQSIDLSAPSSVSPTTELTVSLPAGLGHSGSASVVQLSSVVTKGSLYQSIAPRGTNQATETLSLDLYIDKVKHEISGLS